MEVYAIRSSVSRVTVALYKHVVSVQQQASRGVAAKRCRSDSTLCPPEHFAPTKMNFHAWIGNFRQKTASIIVVTLQKKVTHIHTVKSHALPILHGYLQATPRRVSKLSSSLYLYCPALQTMADTTAPSPKTYKGNCHCGLIKYTVTLPEALAPEGPGQIGKCNCSICTKNGMSLLILHKHFPFRTGSQ